MPNWTRNELNIQTDDPKKILDFKKKVLTKSFCPHLLLTNRNTKYRGQKDDKVQQCTQVQAGFKNPNFKTFVPSSTNESSDLQHYQKTPIFS